MNSLLISLGSSIFVWFFCIIFFAWIFASSKKKYKREYGYSVLLFSTIFAVGWFFLIYGLIGGK